MYIDDLLAHGVRIGIIDFVIAKITEGGTILAYAAPLGNLQRVVDNLGSRSKIHIERIDKQRIGILPRRGTKRYVILIDTAIMLEGSTIAESSVAHSKDGIDLVIDM